MAVVLTDGVVTVRPLTPEDAAPMCEAVAESVGEVSPWLPWCHAGYTRAETDSFIAFATRVWAEQLQFPFGIFAARDGQFLGGISINHIARPNRLANVGYWVRSSRTGQGVAAAATRLVAKYAFEELGLTRLEIACLPGNAPSRRVAEKVGAKLEAVCRNRLVMHGKAYDAALYGLTPEDIAVAGW
ncbi:MAG TPA: GNAT family protein [Steroidobacteraceae bacterium]|nr:GNAT family protein [Steroidobacteraceae bacterium]